MSRKELIFVIVFGIVMLISLSACSVNPHCDGQVERAESLYSKGKINKIDLDQIRSLCG